MIKKIFIVQLSLMQNPIFNFAMRHFLSKLFLRSKIDASLITPLFAFGRCIFLAMLETAQCFTTIFGTWHTYLVMKVFGGTLVGFVCIKDQQLLGSVPLQTEKEPLIDT